MAFRKFTTELRGGVYGRVHLAPDSLLRAGESRHDLVERDPIANDHQVNVASRLFAAFGNRTINTSDADIFGERPQGILKDGGETERPADQVAQWAEYRAYGVRLKAGLMAFYGSANDAGGGEVQEFALHGAGAQAECTNQLPLVESLVNMSEQHA